MMATPVGFQTSGSEIIRHHTTHISAFHFKLANTLDGLKARLEEKTELKNWYSGSKSFIGDYIETQTSLGSTIRIFEVRDGFEFDFKNTTRSDEEYEADLAQFKGALETLGATDFETTEDYY